MANKSIIKFKRTSVEYVLFSFLVVVGLIFLFSGKIKTTEFDMNKGVIQIRKRNLSCHNRSITNYDLKQI